MRVFPIVKVLVVLLLITNSFCAIFHDSRKLENNTKKEITRGVTTENMIVNLLGMPASVTSNSIGDEVWNYKNLSYSTKITADSNTLILWEFTTGDSTDLNGQYHLAITFNQNDVVKKFELISPR